MNETSMTWDEIRALTGYSKRNLQRLKSKGILPCRQVLKGGRVEFIRDSILRWWHDAARKGTIAA